MTVVLTEAKAARIAHLRVSQFRRHQISTDCPLPVVSMADNKPSYYLHDIEDTLGLPLQLSFRFEAPEASSAQS